VPRTVLIVTHQYPPTGGSGVQRVAKFARYLPESGWSPVVVCGRPVQGRPLDLSLAEETAGIPTVRTPSLTPSFAIARALAPVKRLLGGRRGGSPRVAGGKPGGQPLSNRLARRMARDDAVWWGAVARSAALREGRRTGACAVLATGPPFSVLETGVAVARGLGVPLVADFRDSWRDNPSMGWRSATQAAGDEAREREVLSFCAAAVGVSSPIVDELADLGAQVACLIENGYDSEDLVPWMPSAGPLRLAFMGRMYRGHSEPWSLLEALEIIRSRHSGPDVTMMFIGHPEARVVEATQSRGLADSVVFSGYAPHREAIAAVSAADVGVVLIADVPGGAASVTGKLYEYLGIGIPVLVIGPEEGEAAKLVRSVGGGWAVRPDDPEAIAAILERLAEAKTAGTLARHADRAAIQRFERRSLARRMAEVLDEAVDHG
jgi:glycosyltransferase involved in cell wall biosynthesis